MKHLKKINEGLDGNDGAFYDLHDFLQSTKVLYKIENGDHPTIKPNSEKYKEFKDWYESEYIKSGKLDEFIKHLS